MSPGKDDFYADILIYVTGCVLFILAVVIVVLCRMRMTTQKTLPTPPVQKLSKFPLKRQVTESRYKICKDLPALPLRSARARRPSLLLAPLSRRWLLEFLEFLENLENVFGLPVGCRHRLNPHEGTFCPPPNPSDKNELKTFSAASFPLPGRRRVEVGGHGR